MTSSKKSSVFNYIFPLLALLIISLVFTTCNKESAVVITGGYNSSPEETTVRAIVKEFNKGSWDIAYHDGDINGFLDTLENQFNTFNHVDIVGFYSDDMGRLIDEGWLKPYAGMIDQSLYTNESLSALTRNSILYGIPIYSTSSGIIKAIGVGKKIEESQVSEVIDLIEHITSSSNALRIVEAASASSALKENLPDLVAVPDEKGSYCINDGMEFFISVLNQGKSAAFPVTVEITFFPGNATKMQTGTIMPNETTVLRLPFPAECFYGCEFQISVDIFDEVVESDEKNNVVDDFCPG